MTFIEVHLSASEEAALLPRLIAVRRIDSVAPGGTSAGSVIWIDGDTIGQSVIEGYHDLRDLLLRL
jgi:hypothetical protein